MLPRRDTIDDKSRSHAWSLPRLFLTPPAIGNYLAPDLFRPVKFRQNIINQQDSISAELAKYSIKAKLENIDFVAYCNKLWVLVFSNQFFLIELKVPIY